MFSPYDPHRPFEPTIAQIVARLNRYDSTQAAAPGDVSLYRVIHESSRHVEFMGSREACVAFVGRAWWRTLVSVGPRGDEEHDAFAVALEMQRCDHGIWNTDRPLTDALRRMHIGV